MSTTADAFHVELETRGSALIVSLVGSASMEHCEQLNDDLLTACMDKPHMIILDLSRLDFICSIGLGSLVTAYLRQTKNGGQFALAAPSADIKEMLELTKLETLLPVFSSAAESLDNLAEN